jgi:hypothetical protein
MAVKDKRDLLRGRRTFGKSIERKRRDQDALGSDDWVGSTPMNFHPGEDATAFPDLCIRENKEAFLSQKNGEEEGIRIKVASKVPS